MVRRRHAFEPNPWRPLLCRRCGRHGDALAHIGQGNALWESMRAHPSNWEGSE